MNPVDPKRFEDDEFVLEYFGATGFDVNEMNTQLIRDRVQVNLLTVVATLGKALQSERNKPSDSSKADLKSEVESLNKRREAEKKAAENAPTGEIQTAESVSTNPTNLTQTETNTAPSNSNPETAREENNKPSDSEASKSPNEIDI
jgi:hypothetical protein